MLEMSNLCRGVTLTAHSNPGYLHHNTRLLAMLPSSAKSNHTGDDRSDLGCCYCFRWSRQIRCFITQGMICMLSAIRETTDSLRKAELEKHNRTTDFYQAVLCTGTFSFQQYNYKARFYWWKLAEPVSKHAVRHKKKQTFFFADIELQFEGIS